MDAVINYGKDSKTNRLLACRSSASFAYSFLHCALDINHDSLAFASISCPIQIIWVKKNAAEPDRADVPSPNLANN